MENMDLLTQKPMKLLFTFVLLLILLSFGCGNSLAADRAKVLGNEVWRIDQSILEAGDNMDQLARRSEEVSHEVRALKSKGRFGMIDQVRMERLLSSLREVLLERRDLKKLELKLNTDRKEKVAVLYDLLGEEIKRLLVEGENAMLKGDTPLADQVHSEALSHMEERQRLLKRRSPRISVLSEVELPDTEGISFSKQKEIAILLKNDAESLEKNKNELLDERNLLQKELQIKQTFSHFQGFPRGLEGQSIDKQVQSLEEKLSLYDQAIHDHTTKIQKLMERSEEMMESARKQEEELLK